MGDLLLVDDDARIAELLAFFLRKRGHVVRVVGSFAAARVALDERAPDLMLSDFDLGEERADEELPHLAAEGRLPKTLIVSGYLDGEMERGLMGIAGVIGTLRKPFDMDVLEERIGTAIASEDGASRVRADVGDDDGWIDVRSAEAGS